MRYSLLFAPLLLLLAAACTPTLHARAVSYHDGLELNTGKQFAVIADAGQENNLEFKHYAEIVNRQLYAHGLTQAPSLSRADYRVHFAYGTDSGKQQIVSYPDRGYGGLGGYYGSGGYSGVGIGYTIPVYGNRVESYTTYTRQFSLRIEQASGHSTVYQGRVTSSGEAADFAAVAPCMIAALFQNFPGPSGREVSVSLPLASCDAP